MGSFSIRNNTLASGCLEAPQDSLEAPHQLSTRYLLSEIAEQIGAGEMGSAAWVSPDGQLGGEAQEILQLWQKSERQTRMLEFEQWWVEVHGMPVW